MCSREEATSVVSLEVNLLEYLQTTHMLRSCSLALIGDALYSSQSVSDAEIFILILNTSEIKD